MKENDFYNKLFVAGSLKFAIEEASEEKPKLSESDLFASNLATILAREREVVAVYLKLLPLKCKIYIAKNNDWLPEDKEYINKVKEVLISISKAAPMTFDQAQNRDDVKELFITIFNYCLSKFEYRLDKLRKDILGYKDEPYIVSFLSYAISKKVDVMQDFSYSGISQCWTMT
ncbi:hypothetical protein C1646_667733 [Rhizophagus diaphanus]|nr:hypothetical protein C1646_667733 [Rhizophagus diaphanus] [Rhizophagus sp. MUCL 43196]